MRLERYPAGKLKKEIKEILKKYLGSRKYQAFFFGSRVSGKGNERSDIDLGIEGLKPFPSEIVSKIREEIVNLPFLYRVDVVDFNTVEGKFKKIAKEKIELIN